MTWLVPEITLLTWREMTDPEAAWRLARAVVGGAVQVESS
jgi:hypothetical protein